MSSFNDVLRNFLPPTPEEIDNIVGDAGGYAPAPSPTEAALGSGLLDVKSGFEAALGGEENFNAAREDERRAAALAPPDPFDLAGEGKYKDAAKAAGNQYVAAAPRLGLSAAAGAAGLLAGPFAPVAVPLAVAAVNSPYWYGKNLLGQSRAKEDYFKPGGADYGELTDQDKIRAADAGQAQSAADALASVLFPVTKLTPGLGKTILGRMSKGTLAGMVEGAGQGTVQEVSSILNEDPSLEALFSKESLSRIYKAARGGAMFGGPLGGMGQFVAESPSLKRSPEDVQAGLRAARYFTPKAMRAGDDTIVWMKPDQLTNLAKFDGKPSKAFVHTEVPTLSVRPGEMGEAGVYDASGMDAAAAMSSRGINAVPVRIKGLTGQKSIEWNGNSVSLEQEPYTVPGDGSVKRPAIVSRETDLAPARTRAGKGRGPGYIKFDGMDMAIDVPKGGLRKGIGADGADWRAQAPVDYGHIKRGKDADGEPMDVWLGPDLQSPQALVIEQQDPATGKFDEHKAMLGFSNEKDAVAAYDMAFPDGSGPARRGKTVSMPMSKFKAWAETGDTSEPVSKMAVEGRLPVTVDDIHNLADQMGIQWDNDPSFMRVTQDMFGKAHLDQLNPNQLKRFHDMLEAARESGTPAQAVVHPLMMSYESDPARGLPGNHLQPKEDTGRRTDNNEYSAQVAYHNAISRAFSDENGDDRLTKALGLHELSSVVGSGWWNGESHPVTQQEQIMENSQYFQPGVARMGDAEVKVPRLTPVTRTLLNTDAAARGLGHKQEGVAWHIAYPVDKPESANGIDLDLGEPATDISTEKVMADLKKAGLDDKVIPVQTAFGLRLFRALDEVNGRFEGHDPAWATKAGEIAGKRLKADSVGYNFVDSGVVHNDWNQSHNTTTWRDDNGATHYDPAQEYINAFNAGATPHARRELGDIIRKVQGVERSEAERRGLHFDDSINPSILKALGEDTDGERVPNPKAAASIPLGGLDRSPTSQMDIYNLFGETNLDTLDPAAADGRFDTTKRLQHYNLNHLIQRPWHMDRMLDRYGYRVKYFSFDHDPQKGIHWRPPELRKDGYGNGTLWVYDPRNAHGSFDDANYTNAWRVPHELGHALTEEFVQRKYGDSQREGRLGRTGTSYRGPPGKQVEIETRPLTLKEAQRTVEWEDLAFRAQRMLLADHGIHISDADFAREYNANMADAVYRVLSGDFGNPGKRGFVPNGKIADLKSALQLLDESEKRLAADQGRPPTKGINLDKWRQVRDDEILGKMKRAAANRKKGRANQSERIGLSGDSRYDTPTEMLPGLFNPLQKTVQDDVKMDIGTPKEWKGAILNRPGIKADEVAWTGLDSWLDALPADQKITKSDITAFLKDKAPDIQETYFGTPPGRAKSDNLPALIPDTKPPEVTASPHEDEEIDLPSFDRHNHDEVVEATDSDRENYIDSRIDDELNHHWNEADTEDLRGLAEDKATAESGADRFVDDLDNDETPTFSSIEDVTSMRGLQGVASDLGLAQHFDEIERQLELPGIQRTNEQKLGFAKNSVAAEALKNFKKIIADAEAKAGRAPGRSGRHVDPANELAKHYPEFFENEDAAHWLHEEPDELKEAFHERRGPGVRDSLSEMFDEDWPDQGGRIWKSSAGGHDYEIKEEDGRDGGYTLYINGDESGSYGSWQAVTDAAEGFARDPDNFDANTRSSSKKQIEPAVTQDQLPPQSVYGGRARWASRALPGGRDYREMVIQVKNLPGAYSHGHWSGVANPAMHVRSQVFDFPHYPNSLFLTELQSDLFSEGARGQDARGFFHSDLERQGEQKRIAERSQQIVDEQGKLATKVRDMKQEAMTRAVYRNGDLAQAAKFLGDWKAQYKNEHAEFVSQGIEQYASELANDRGPYTVWGRLVDQAAKVALDKHILKDVGDRAVGPGEKEAVARIKAENESIYRNMGKTLFSGLGNKLNKDIGSRDDIEAALLDKGHDADAIFKKIGKTALDDPALAKSIAKVQEHATKMNALAEEARALKYNPVPAMPWGKHWFDFALKRMTKWGIERGYDSISWPTGPVTSKIEQWGIHPYDLYYNAYSKKMTGAIVDRQDVDAPRAMAKLGEKFGVKPRMVNMVSGLPVKPVSIEVELPVSNNLVGFVVKDGVTTGQSINLGRDMSAQLFAKHGNAAGPARAKIDAYEESDGAGNTAYHAKSAFNTGVWVMPINDKMREAFKKPLPGYARGGLVRAA